MERWLHQHLFKVGWLLTRNFNVTTVLYYTLFLPGILLHEVISWLMAGVLNVHAAQAVAWPQSQEIGELRLNFVRIANSIPTWKRFIITTAPLIVGMLLTYHVANNVFQLEKVFGLMSSGALNDVGDAFGRLFGTPDFWLWFYLLFTVSNTMFANLAREIKNLQTLFASAAAILVSIGIVSATTATLSSTAEPFERALTVLMELLVLMISVNFLSILLLGTVESVIERLTNNSATFRKGRMITMTRAEMLAERTRERERIYHKTARATRNPAADSGISSIYKMAFPIPTAPNRETGSQLQLEIETASAAKESSVSVPAPRPPLTLTSPAASVVPPATATPAVRPPVSGRPTPATPIKKESETTDQAKKPADAPVAPVRTPLSPSRPAVSAFGSKPEGNRDEAEADNKPATPLRPTASAFNRPTASAFTSKLDDEDEENVKPATPLRSTTSAFNRPAASAFTSKLDDEDEDGDKPATSLRTTASAFNRPAASAFTSKLDDEDEEDDKPVTPLRATASAFNRPATSAFTSKLDDEDEEDDKPKPSRFAPSPFGKPAATPAAEKPAAPIRPATAAPFAPTGRPAPFTRPATRPTDNELASDEALPSPFDADDADLKPAAPKNAAYNRMAASPLPLSRPLSVPKPTSARPSPKQASSRMDDDDIEGTNYDPDEEFYVDDEDDLYSSDED